MPVGRYLATAHPAEKYAIIVMDPPYADPTIEDTIRTIGVSGLLDSDGLLVVGHSSRVTLADEYGLLHRLKFRRVGDSCFSIYELADQSNEQRAANEPSGISRSPQRLQLSQRSKV